MGLSSGTFTRPNDFTTDASLGIDPTATKFDQEFDDIKDALDIAIYGDGQQNITADIPWNGKKITGLGNATAGTDALNRDTADARYLLKAQLAAGLPVNASLANSVGSSELTVALKGADGNDPSASNPVVLPFRSATAGTGTITARTVTAATSITMNSTALIGTSNSTAFSLWVVAFDDAGTIRLGVINCLSGTSIYPLQQQGIASSTGEDNASDSAHVFYTGTGVTSKPYIVLGRLIWNSGLATAGTWNAVADVVVNMAPGVKLPGDRVQTARTVDSEVASGSTALPFDNSIPQSGEGVQFMTQAVTPTVAANVLRVQFLGHFGYSGANTEVSAGLFQDATAGALATTFAGMDGSPGTGYSQVSVIHDMRAGTTSSTTFKIRANQNSANTIYFNGNTSGTRLFGGVIASFLQVEEIVA